MIPHPSTIAETAFVARMDRMSDAEIEEIRTELPQMYAKWCVGKCEAAERLKKMADDYEAFLEIRKVARKGNK